MKKIIIRIPFAVYNTMLKDLQRRHAFAFERIGLAFSTHKKLNSDTWLVIVNDYQPVKDEHYIKDRSVGARINSDAIRSGMQQVLNSKNGCFLVHMHEGTGKPHFSSTDVEELPGVVQGFRNVLPDELHGLLLLNEDSVNALAWIPKDTKAVEPERIMVISSPMQINFNHTSKLSFAKGRYDRQSFLGKHSQTIFSNVKVGIVGLGGGGSHIVQQLAYLGISNFVIFDMDRVDRSNLNRLVGAGEKDVSNKTRKTEVARRVIKNVLPNANIICCDGKWETFTSFLHECDVAFGGIDSFLGRRDLEAECRRYLIPYIDIGMDVHKVSGEAPSMVGQVILSLPGKPCMTCLGFLTEDTLAKEASKYGNAGEAPQVVWSNGVLASTAIGVFVDLVTGWTKKNHRMIYSSYNGNEGTVSEHIRLQFNGKGKCSHFPVEEAGVPKYKTL